MSDDRTTDGRDRDGHIEHLEARIAALRKALAEAVEENRRLRKQLEDRLLEDMLP